MSKINRLIKELCPNGVEYRELEKITDINLGRRVTKAEIKNNPGKYPVWHGGETPMGYINKTNCLANTVIVANTGSIGYVNWLSVDSWCSDASSIIATKEGLSSRYIYHFLKDNEYLLQNYRRIGGVPTLELRKLKSFPIPLPPLPVQEEIVRILDNFTELTIELTTELTTELIARRKQYEYYRDELLTFGDEVEWKPLGDIGIMERGSGLKKTDFIKKGVPCIHYGQIYTYYGTFADKTISFVSPKLGEKLKKVYNGDLIIAVTSENLEDVCKPLVWLGDKYVVTGGHTAIFRHSQNPKYIAYYLQTYMFFKQKRKITYGTKVIEVTPRKLEKIRIPLPSLSEQERIVSILDKFEALVNDISIGLPAEIEARQKQYEYYRGKLLAFKKLDIKEA